MKDTSTRKPLQVSTDGTSGPYIMVPVSQLDEVQALLDSNRVPYWVDEQAISLNGEPEVSAINIGRGADPRAIQRILDGVP
jgi:hypothetical protein